MFVMRLPVQLALGHHQTHSFENDSGQQPQDGPGADERRDRAPELHQVQQTCDGDESE